MSYRAIFILFFLCQFFGRAVAAENMIPTSIVKENGVCVQCHENRDHGLVADWRASVHAQVNPAIDCIACHGGYHKGIADRARRDKVCVTCHGGEKGTVVHSYSSSKHGTLMRLEEKQQNWSLPLKLANYRVPGCSYCHMYSGNHNVSITVRQSLMDDSKTEEVQDFMQAACRDCHSPRYISRLFSNGEAMLEIARKKVREVSEIVREAENEFTKDDLLKVRKIMKDMEHHLRNVYLGVAHQSPDYQWWHGHPALDGDLLRIKGKVGQLRREKNSIVIKSRK